MTMIVRRRHGNLTTMMMVLHDKLTVHNDDGDDGRHGAYFSSLRKALVSFPSWASELLLF